MPCARPLDPIDVEAIASGAAPVLDTAAGEHAASCESCREAIARARRLEALLAEPAAAPGRPDLVAGDFAARVLRLRAFSPAERWSLSLWKAPLLLFVATALAGIVLLAAPTATLADQAGSIAALAAAAGAVLRALADWSRDVLRSGPSGLEGLAQALRREAPLGWIALLALLPSAAALSRVLARERRPAR